MMRALLARSGLADVPRAPLWLGLAGLLPFYGALLAALLGVRPAIFILIGYGAIILSFLGGARWGLAMREREAGWRDYGFAVLPSLVGWLSLYLTPPLSLALLALSHAALGIIDRAEVRTRRIPTWYGSLRTLLASGATLALALALLVPDGR